MRRFEQQAELGGPPRVGGECGSPVGLVQEDAIVEVRLNAAQQNAAMAKGRRAVEIEPVHGRHRPLSQECRIAVLPPRAQQPVAARRGLIEAPRYPSPLLEYPKQLASLAARMPCHDTPADHVGFGAMPVAHRRSMHAPVKRCDPVVVVHDIERKPAAFDSRDIRLRRPIP